MFLERFQTATLINPSFPNWNKSFVSGQESPLFEVEHRIALDPVELLSLVWFKPSAEGPPAHVHGGATAALIDEVMGILVWNQNMPVVTKKLEVEYRLPLPLKEEAQLSTVIEEITDKNVRVRTNLFCNKKTPCVVAHGVFHRLTENQLKNFTP